MKCLAADNTDRRGFGGTIQVAGPPEVGASNSPIRLIRAIRGQIFPETSLFASRQDLGVVTPAETQVDPNTYQPDLKVHVINGIPRLTGKKRGVDGFNVYVRLEGETTWRLLVAKRVRFPYDDDSAVAHPGTPEEREYQIIGVLGDHEIGQPGAIATAVVSG